MFPESSCIEDVTYGFVMRGQVNITGDLLLYFFPHSMYVRATNVVGKSNTFPRRNIGFGPGGSG